MHILMIIYMSLAKKGDLLERITFMYSLYIFPLYKTKATFACGRWNVHIMISQSRHLKPLQFNLENFLK